MGRRLCVRVETDSAVASADKTSNRPGCLAAERVVVGQQSGMLLKAIGVEPLNRMCYGAVEVAASLNEKAFVCHFLGQRVFEGVLTLWSHTLGVNELEPLELVELRRNALVVF